MSLLHSSFLRAQLCFISLNRNHRAEVCAPCTADTGIWVKADCREEGSVSTKYPQPVLAKMLASARRQGCYRGASSGLHLMLVVYVEAFLGWLWRLFLSSLS